MRLHNQIAASALASCFLRSLDILGILTLQDVSERFQSIASEKDDIDLEVQLLYGFTEKYDSKCYNIPAWLNHSSPNHCSQHWLSEKSS